MSDSSDLNRLLESHIEKLTDLVDYEDTIQLSKVGAEIPSEETINDCGPQWDDFNESLMLIQNSFDSAAANLSALPSNFDGLLTMATSMPRSHLDVNAFLDYQYKDEGEDCSHIIGEISELLQDMLEAIDFSGRIYSSDALAVISPIISVNNSAPASVFDLTLVALNVELKDVEAPPSSIIEDSALDSYAQVKTMGKAFIHLADDDDRYRASSDAYLLDEKASYKEEEKTISATLERERLERKIRKVERNRQMREVKVWKNATKIQCAFRRHRNQRDYNLLRERYYLGLRCRQEQEERERREFTAAAVERQRADHEQQEEERRRVERWRAEEENRLKLEKELVVIETEKIEHQITERVVESQEVQTELLSASAEDGSQFDHPCAEDSPTPDSALHCSPPLIGAPTKATDQLCGESVSCGQDMGGMGMAGLVVVPHPPVTCRSKEGEAMLPFPRRQRVEAHIREAEMDESESSIGKGGNFYDMTTSSLTGVDCEGYTGSQYDSDCETVDSDFVEIETFYKPSLAIKIAESEEEDKQQSIPSKTESRSTGGNLDVASYPVGRIDAVYWDNLAKETSRRCADDATSILHSLGKEPFMQDEERGERGGEAERQCPLLHALRSWASWHRESRITQESSYADFADSTTHASVPPSDLAALTSQEKILIRDLGLNEPRDSNNDKHRENDINAEGPADVVYESLSFCVEELRSVAFLRKYSCLTRLELNVNNLKDVSGLGALTKLEELSVKDNQLSSIEDLRRLVSLKVLRLDANGLDSLDPLDRLSNLSQLTVNTNRLTLFPMLHCPKLQRLELYHNQIQSVSVSSLSELCSLMHLDLGRNKLSFISGHALSQCRLLHTLVLSQNQLTAVPTPLYLPNLRQLWLSGNQIEDVSAWASQPGAHLPIGSSSAPATAHVFLPLVEKLHLQDNQIRCINFGSLDAMPSLTELDVSFNQINSVRALAGIVSSAASENLRVLHIQDNPIWTKSPVQAANVGITSTQLALWLLSAAPTIHTLSGDSISAEAKQGLPLLFIDANPKFHSGALTSEELLSSYFATSAPAVARSDNIDQSPSSSIFAVTMRNEAASLMRKLSMPKELTRKWKTGVLLRIAHCFPSGSFTGSELLQLPIDGINDTVDSKTSHTYLESCRFKDTLRSLSLEQNVLRAFEKAEMRGANVSASTTSLKDNLALTSAFTTSLKDNLALTSSSCDTALVELMQRHVDIMLGIASAQDGTESPSPAQRIVYFNPQKKPRDMGREGKAIIVAGTAAARDSLTVVPLSPIVATDDDATGGKDRIPANDPVYSRVFASAAATAVQKVYRGVRVRRQLEAALSSARYLDEELDDIMGGGEIDELMLEMEGFDLDPAELGDNWLRGSVHTNAGISRNVMVDKTIPAIETTTAPSMVYGDHKRGASWRALSGYQDKYIFSKDEEARTINADADECSVNSEQLPASVRAPPRVSSSSPLTTAATAAAATAVSSSLFSITHPRASRPPSSAMSTMSALTASTQADEDEEETFNDDIGDEDDENVDDTHARTADKDGQYYSSNEQSVVSGSPHNRQARGAKAFEVAEEWGVQDPKLLQALLKRNRRMKAFVSAKETRARQRDPQFRYERFLKHAGLAVAASSGPGDEPDIDRGHPRGQGGGSGWVGVAGRGVAPGRGRGGRRRVRDGGFLPPAWVAGEDAPRDHHSS